MEQTSTSEVRVRDQLGKLQRWGKPKVLGAGTLSLPPGCAAGTFYFLPLTLIASRHTFIASCNRIFFWRNRGPQFLFMAEFLSFYPDVPVPSAIALQKKC